MRAGTATSKPPKTSSGVGSDTNGGSTDATARFGTTARPPERSSAGRVRIAGPEVAAQGAGVDESAAHAADESHQLFDRWEKEGLMAQDAASTPEEEESDVLARTPEQEARRAWFLRFVAALVGFLAVIGVFAFLRTRGDGASSLRSDPGPNLVPTLTTATVTAPAGGAVPSLPLATAKPNEPLPAGSTKAPENAPAASAGAVPAGSAAPSSAPFDARKLPLIDVEIPTAPDAATAQLWEIAAKRLNDRDFKGADSVLAELGKKADRATREAARLARAIWWINNGKQTEVRPVIADLANNAATASVRQRARELVDLR
jgi:hypothetical protein